MVTDIKSSYAEHNLGKTIYDFVLETEPVLVVEFGCLHGYSTVHIAKALKELGRGILYACDLWEDYPYNRGVKDIVKANLKKHGVEDYVAFKKEDYNAWLQNPTPFDLLHVDISNDGDTIEKTYKALGIHLLYGSKILFEGGSAERDQIEWMKKYKRRPIHPLKDKIPFKVLNEDFPSISVIQI